MVAWRDVIVDGDHAVKISTILRKYIAPGAADSAYREVARFFKSKRPGQATDVLSVEFGSLRRTAESKMQMGGAFPEAFDSARRIKNAALPRAGKSLASASAQGDSGSPAAPRRMRRLLGRCGRAARRDVLLAAGVAAPSYENADFEAWAARRKAKKKSGEKKKEEGDPGRRGKSDAHWPQKARDMPDAGCTSKCVRAKSPVFAQRPSATFSLFVSGVNSQRAGRRGVRGTGSKK